MALQITPHTLEQVSGLQSYSKKKVCPSCDSKTFSVIETRSVPDGQRRRYCCDRCDFRQTLFEISKEAYDELIESRRLLRDMRHLLSASAPKELRTAVEHIVCYTCDFFDKKGCSFGYPEAGSVNATGCTQFQFKADEKDE
mgnify:CR=1 FL=1|jgi:hypothetical protein|tara:strand:- start:1633 stop:2055 length:423 start_codon:yes stop_codon:yes gene_type:complete